MGSLLTPWRSAGILGISARGLQLSCEGGFQPQREPLRRLGLLSSSIFARTSSPKHSDFEACANAFDRGSSASSFDSKRSCPFTILWFGPCTPPESTLVAFRHGDCSYAHHPLHTLQLPRRRLHGYSWRKWRPLSSCYLVHSTTELQVLRSPAFRASSRLIRSLKHCSAESGAHIVDPITTLRTWTWSVLQHSTHPAAVDKSHPVLRLKPLPWNKIESAGIFRKSSWREDLPHIDSARIQAAPTPTCGVSKSARCSRRRL